MLKDVKLLADKLTTECKLLATSTVRELTIDINSKYGIPYDMISDLLTLRTDFVDQTEFVLYCFCAELLPKSVRVYYTDVEIKKYSETKYKVKKLKFPITFDVIQIAEDQWIGRISVKELMQFRDAQMIIYNENAQRTLTRIVKGEKEMYKITVNRNAVNGIISSYKNGTYIPNTITLNIPEDADFTYSDGKLKVKSASGFDILDGYHRYIAMSNMYNLNRKFDYNMELRLVCFPIEKARQFIWQEDQKTQMSKVDSESFNQNSASNQIVNGLNRGTFTGLINPNKAIIDSAWLSKAIDYVYVTGNRNMNRSQIIKIRNQIYECLECMVDEEPEIIDKRWKARQIAAFTVASKYGQVGVYDRYALLNTTEYANNVDTSTMSKMKKDLESKM